jgi:uncharacterized membrane protein HdeD (DUF308 family)
MNRSISPAPASGLNVFPAQWGWLAVRGIAAVIFGILAFTWPGLTIMSLAIMWGAYAMVDGLFALIYGGAGGGSRRWAYVIIGLIGVLAGLCAFLWPGATAITLVMIIGFWAVAIGIFEIIYAIQYRAVSAHPWVIGLSGALSVAVGGYFVIYPGAGALSLIWLIGLYAIANGTLMFIAAIQLRCARR